MKSPPPSVQWHSRGSPSVRRAWIEIWPWPGWSVSVPESPSVRRAWIEIPLSKLWHPAWANKSPSVRRAWIEIPSSGGSFVALWVTLREEGVD